MIYIPRKHHSFRSSTFGKEKVTIFFSAKNLYCDTYSLFSRPMEVNYLLTRYICADTAIQFEKKKKKSFSRPCFLGSRRGCMLIKNAMQSFSCRLAPDGAFIIKSIP